MYFLYEPCDGEKCQDILITESYYDVVNEVHLQPDTYEYLNPGDDYEKTAPRLTGYKRIGHRIDDGEQLVTRIVQIKDIQDDHHVFFLYEPCEGEQCRDILITESYFDVENNRYIQPDTYEYLNPGNNYQKDAPSISGYVRIGHRINNQEALSDLTARIGDVQDDHHVYFLYEPEIKEPEEYIKITESYYDTVNEQYLQPDTHTMVRLGGTYAKSAPGISGYKRTGHRMDEGADQAGVTVTMEAVTEPHHITFLYEPDIKEPEEYIKITESYYDTVNEQDIQPDTYTMVRLGGTYAKSAPGISGYKRTGHKVDDGPDQTGITVTIEAVTESHHVTFLYEPLKDGKKDPKHIITESYFDVVNEQYIQPDTFTLVTDGGSYTRTAPSIAGYRRVAHRIDNGMEQSTLTARISPVLQDHQVHFFYEPIAITGTCRYAIIESYYDTVNDVYIHPDTYTAIRSGRDYVKTQPAFSGYKRIGYKIDNGAVQTSLTAVIRDVVSSHHVVFLYEPLEDPEKPDPTVIITESYYDVMNQQYIRLDTYSLMGYGSDYSKTAPGFSGYKRVGHRVDDGQAQADFTARIPNVTADHHVTFLYEPVEEETEQELLIRESYYDVVTKAFIQADTYTKVAYGADYSKTAPTISGYKRVGHSIDGGVEQASLTASLTHVIHDHHVLFLYEPVEGVEEPVLTITESYYDVENEKFILPDTSTQVAYGDGYTKTAPVIDGYERVGHKVDDGGAQNTFTASIQIVIENHHVTFLYKPVSAPTEPEPGENDKDKVKECSCKCSNMSCQTMMPMMGCIPIMPVMMMPVMPMIGCMPGWNWNGGCQCNCTGGKDGDGNGGGTTDPPNTDGDEDYIITEHYIDRETSKAIRSNTTAKVAKGQSYSKAAPDISDYIKVGHSVDTGIFSPNLTASIRNISQSHDVYFYYEGDDCA